MFCEPDTYRRDLLENLDTLEAVIHRAVITYGKLQLQSQDVQINPVQAVDDSLIHESLVTESTTLEVNLNTDVKALDAGSVITESSRTKSDKHDTSSSLRTYITHAVDADIRPVNDQVPFAEVQLTAQHNVLANEQQHTEQSEPIYDTYLLEKVDSNTTPDSTNMCHRGGEIDQDAEQYQAKSPLLKAEFLKTNDMVEKEVFNELSNRFLQLENITMVLPQVDVNNVLSKPVTPHYLPKNRESAAAKPHQKMTQDKTRIPSHKDMASTRAHCTPNACTPKPRNIYRSSPVSKCSGGMSNVQSPKIRNNNPVEPKNHTHKPGRRNGIGQRFSLNKSSAVHEKPHTPRSYLRMETNGFEFSRVVLGGYLLEAVLKLKCRYICQSLKKDSGLVTKKVTDIIRQEFKEFKSDEHASNDVWTKQFKPRSSSNDVWTKQFKPRSSSNDRSLLELTNIIPKPDLALELDLEPCKKTDLINLEKLHVSLVGQPEHKDDGLTEVREAVAREVHEKSKVIEESAFPPYMDPKSSDSNVNSSQVLNESRNYEKVQRRLSYQKGNKVREKETRFNLLIRSTDKPDEISMDKESCSQGLRSQEKHDSDDEEDDDDDEGLIQRDQPGSGPGPQLLTPRTISSGLVPQPPSLTPNVPPTKNDWDSLFFPIFDEYFNPSPSVVQHILVAVIQEPVVSTEDDHGIEVAHMDNDLILAGRYLLQTLGQEKLEFLMKKVGMQSMSPETMKKLADETEELWCKGSCPALSISKIKAASYPDFGLELLVPEQMLIDDVCTYNVSEKYGISHWWFTRQKFYIDRYESPSPDHQEHKIAEKGFKNLYPSDFEDLNLLLLQAHLGHLSGYEFKHDYTIIESPRAVVFPVNNNERKIMRFNEIYKFSNGTLTRILETLDYRVKEFKIKRLNLGMNTCFCTEKDMTRSKEFITAIERRLKTRRIYRNLECFVGGRVRDIDYRLLQRTE
ncbi:hypothetical protein Tco_0937811 [Tanacetum coccineum]|uniref:Uncharacterized protein n=1 Tax=Tanacetum coccineum TaxID=301880 RepID=A0ABQ5DFB4_9ASTR